MRNEILVRLHAAGATHRELRLFSNAPDSNHDAESFFIHRHVVRDALSVPWIPSDRISAILDACYLEPAVNAFANASKIGARVVLEGDGEYPQAFLPMPRRPFLLYVRGTLPRPEVSVSVVWSRKASPYGKEVTKRFVTAFCARGIATVSGWASWIDSAAHLAAVEAGGITVAFVWTGIDIDYPRSNRALFDSVVESGGAVVSAFAPGVWPMAYHFPIRNALVACFSDGTLVTEAAEKSGSLITAKLALDFWKEVFAVPWDVLRPGSLGANSLIRDGSAKCVSSPDDVLCEFSGRLPEFRRVPGSSRDVWTDVSSIGHTFIARSPVCQVLTRLGSSDPETLSFESGVPFERVLSELSELEISWAAFSDMFGNYCLRR